MGKISKQARRLYDALVLKGVPCEMEGKRPYKKVDILIEKLKLCIEVDGDEHYYNPKNRIRDFERDFNSFKEGYYTLRIADEVVDKHVDQIAFAIEKIFKVNESNHKPRRTSNEESKRRFR